MPHQDGTVVHHDNSQGPPPNYDPYMISTPDHPFFPGAPITKRMFHNLHQVVFAIVILCAWTLVPAVLKAEAGRHFKFVAFKNNISKTQQENLAVLALSSEIGGEKTLFRTTLPLGLLAEFLSHNYADAICYEITNHQAGPRVLNSGPGLVNLSENWNWAAIRAFDPFYSSDLADSTEATNFFEEVILVTSELVTSWDIVYPQLRETINIIICHVDPWIMAQL
ncbi:uncharacterized protein F5147DRAFT_658485 [Suillus discolor]|uniref:Uncharacterized protein n=1 Tax=Suillus discolor TaxID=1912936 RepID=A0A9P7EUM8_9AGAM|nr:uncharacterized protein F5147DRAFT_658485 [Suillus discolor]KAG2089126.1 hypothetical protein F5147DRAFT_658485 [Suillus discolor]